MEAKRRGIPITPQINAKNTCWSPSVTDKALTTLKIVRITPRLNGIAAKKFFINVFIRYLSLCKVSISTWRSSIVDCKVSISDAWSLTILETLSIELSRELSTELSMANICLTSYETTVSKTSIRIADIANIRGFKLHHIAFPFLDLKVSLRIGIS